MTLRLMMKTALISAAMTFSLAKADDIDPEFLSRAFVVPPLEKSHHVYGRSSSDALNPDSIKIFVWNIYKARKDNYHEDFAHYSQGYDLFMIQEAMTTEDELVSKLAKDGFRWDFGVSFGYRKNPEKETGTMLGSHVEPTRTWIARTVDNEPIVKTPKTLTMGIYPIQGQEHGLMVINIHALNMTNQKAFERHLLQSMAQVQNHQGPLVFAGDFNTRTKERMSFMRELLIEKWGMTEISFRNDERMTSFGTGHIIDYVFVRGLEIIDSEVLGKLKSSDHKAMLFEAKVSR